MEVAVPDYASALLPVPPHGSAWAMPFLLLAAFTFALAATFHRWGTRGAAALPLACFLVEAAIGTYRTLQPHRDMPGTMGQAWSADPLYHWGCHSAVVWPAYLLLGTAGTILLHVRRKAETSFAEQLVLAAAAMTFATVPAVGVALWWGVMVLGCDTL